MKNTRELMTDVLNSMDTEFTSHEFGIAAKDLGISKRVLRDQPVFLKKHCIHKSRFIWQKKSAGVTPIEQESSSVSDAIVLLKMRGYKISRPVTKYEEL